MPVKPLERIEIFVKRHLPSPIDGSQLAMIVGAVLTIFGIGFLIFDASTRTPAKASLDWPNTTGVVENTHITTEEVWAQGTPQTDRHPPKWMLHRPQVEYSYKVNGEVHKSTKISFFKPTQFRYSAPAEQFLADYPLGGKIRVRYNPERPSQAVLIPGGPDVGITSAELMGWMLVAVGPTICAVGLGVFVYFRWLRRQDEAEYVPPTGPSTPTPTEI